MLLLAIVGIGAVFIVMQVVHALSSMDEIDKQVNQTVNYRAQLTDYLNKHNLTTPVDKSKYNLLELEDLVKVHKIYCKTGMIEEFYNTTLNLNGMETCKK